MKFINLAFTVLMLFLHLTTSYAQAVDEMTEESSNNTEQQTAETANAAPDTDEHDLHQYTMKSPEMSDQPKPIDLNMVNKLLNDTPPTVTDKPSFPKGVDKNNYISYASYWWPDPSKPDGLPYIRKDGKRNKELVNQGDAGKFHTMAQSVVLLTRAYKQTGDQRYAEKAAEFLKVWYLDPKTRMNPNLDNGQMIMGKNQGTKSGLVELRYNISLLEVVPYLLESEHWSYQEHEQFKDWYKEFYKWMISSKIGKQAATKFENNHGSWYDAHIVSIATFLGRDEFAKKVVERAKKRRVEKQIKPDGTQPMELKRTRSMTYTLFNLEALFALSRLGDRLGIDLKNYTTKDGKSIQRAYEYALQYKDKIDVWKQEHKQIDEVEDWRWEILHDYHDILLNVYR